jgi:hypothetical protein
MCIVSGNSRDKPVFCQYEQVSKSHSILSGYSVVTFVS